MIRRLTSHAILAMLFTTAGVAVSASPASAVGDKDCGDFASQRAAQIFFLKHGGPSSDPHRLDSDSDGIACESNPAPTYYGTTLPGSSPDPKPSKVSSTVNLALSRGKAIKGEKVKLVATVKPQARRTVVFQTRRSGSWRGIERESTTRRGRATYSIRAPRSDGTYRAVVVKKKSGGKIYLGDKSGTRTLNVQAQRVTLDLSRSTAAEGREVRATVTATPIRHKRPVLLQVYRSGSWDTVRIGQESRRGIDSFTLPDLDAGEYRVRAKVASWHGAAVQESGGRRLTVRDVTPPDVPTGLVATAGDQSVQLSWSPVAASDLAHYVVYYRTVDSSAWLTAGSPTSSTVISGLANGTTYVFTVSAVDVSGNESDGSAEAQSVPNPPAP